MKRLMWLYTLLILVGCTEEAYLESTSSMTDEEIYAVIENENTDSRTYIDEQIRMRWTAEDCITLFRKTTYNRKYMFTGKTGANAGGFKQVSTDDDFWYGADVSYNYAAYPYSADMELDESGYFKLTMPAEQTYAENSFGLGANTMVAVSETGQLTFKNVGSYLRVRLYGEDVSVSSITLNSKGDESISGTAKVTPVLNGYPTCEMIGSGKSIRLICPEPVAISNDVNNPTDFWIVVPPVTLTNGFSVTVENSEGDTQVFEVAKTFTFERNMYTDMKREVSISSEDAIPYLTFTADAEQTFTMSKAVETLEYSVNGGEWKELGTNTVAFGGNHGKLQIRGKSKIGTVSEDRKKFFLSNNIIFGNDVEVSCHGDLRTLVDYDNYDNADTSNARFGYLFAFCGNLVTIPELPATVLADYCYHGLFYKCEKLTKLPRLPATTLAESCYASMFSGCSNLVTIPESLLPATTLAKSCYSGMFNSCSSLVTIPESLLPATTLAESCYSTMFSYCSNLVTIPESLLPSDTLARKCYYNMFSFCDNLNAAPMLPATELAPICYGYMFSYCINLTEAPMLPAKIVKGESYLAMFDGCSKLSYITMLATSWVNDSFSEWTRNVSTTGTFTKNKEMPYLPTGAYGIPEGWTVVNYEDGNTFEDDGPPPVEDEGNMI